MRSYLELMDKILTTGDLKPSRPGIDTRSLFGEHLRFDLQWGFPLITTKRLHFHSILTELLWFIKGDTNVKYLHDHGVTIWDEWADKDGNLGPVYGKQWRSWSGIKHDGKGRFACIEVDQLKNVQDRIRSHPNCRRHIVSAWNPMDVPNTVLPPCHLLFQFNVREQRVRDFTKPDAYHTVRYLDCHMYQRSADYFLDVPYNIASYAMLTMMMARATDLQPGNLIISFGDVHIYENHIEQCGEQLSRKPKMLPELWVDPTIKDIFEFRHEHFKLIDYK